MSGHRFLMIKREGYDRAGARLTAQASAQALLDSHLWPLWSNTRNRRVIAAGAQLAIYLSGDGKCTVIATAEVASVGPWTRQIARDYPLELDGTPEVVLHLANIELLERPIPIRERLHRLSFVNQGTRKWGVAFMGGTRAISETDFDAMTAPA